MSHQARITIDENAANPVPGGQESAAREVKDWKKTCEDLTAERSRLQVELQNMKQVMEKLKLERDEYAGYVYALTRKEFDFEKEELLALVGTQQPLREFIAELEQKQGG